MFQKKRAELNTRIVAAREQYEAAALEVAKGDPEASQRMKVAREQISELKEQIQDLEAATLRAAKLEANDSVDRLFQAKTGALKAAEEGAALQKDAATRIAALIQELGAEVARFMEGQRVVVVAAESFSKDTKENLLSVYSKTDAFFGMCGDLMGRAGLREITRRTRPSFMSWMREKDLGTIVGERANSAIAYLRTELELDSSKSKESA